MHRAARARADLVYLRSLLARALTLSMLSFPAGGVSLGFALATTHSLSQYDYRGRLLVKARAACVFQLSFVPLGLCGQRDL